MTNEDLIQIAADLCFEAKMSEENTAGTVGCALLSEKGNVYKGVCVDTISGLGFCAEHTAIAAMVTDKEFKIRRIVAVWKNEKGEVHILHPCGRCREFMRQVDSGNMEAEVILGKGRVLKLKDLLPYEDDFEKIEL